MTEDIEKYLEDDLLVISSRLIELAKSFNNLSLDDKKKVISYAKRQSKNDVETFTKVLSIDDNGDK